MPFPRLPEQATAKLAEIADAAFEIETRVRATVGRIRDIRATTATLTPEQVSAARDEIDRLDRKLALDQAASRVATDLASAVSRWLAHVPSTMELVPAADPPSTRSAGETSRQAVDRLRAHVAALSLRRRAVVAALPTPDETQPLIAAYVEQKVREFRDRARIDFPDGATRITFEGEPKALEVAAWLNGDALTRRLREAVDQARLAVGREIMPRADREAALADIDRQTAAAEREEEAIIVEARRTDSAVIERRADASPAAILGVEMVPRAVAPEPVDDTPPPDRAEIRDVPPQARVVSDDGALDVAVGTAAVQRTRARRK
ncbi:MAG: hypothetical protein M9932_00710 [Xanthobacteraceae bacterium]|nr:hypothetical protein [Xanthobacteraceae bacterium]